MEPITISLIVLTVALLLLLLFLPGRGLLARLRALRGARQRERVEDALKFLFGRKQDNRPASPESLAGVLQISQKMALQLINEMETQGLVSTRGSVLELRPQGEKMALQIVRAHRLWERYLADEARLPLEKVHSEAHRREHTLSPSEVDELDAAMGYPMHDPHGDPIPNREGSFPEPRSGEPLTGLKVGASGQIVQLEDEPPLAYAQILAEGLRLGQTVRILEVTAERYVLTDGENEYRLAPAVAVNVLVAVLPESEIARDGAIPLNELPDTLPGQIIQIDESCQGFTRRRFLDLGLTPGTEIFPELGNAFGDPRAYRVRGTLIALRREQSSMIWVRKLSDESQLN